MPSIGRDTVLCRISDEKEKIVKYAMLIKQLKESNVGACQNALMDIIDEYKFKIQEAKDVIAYLEVELEWVY